VDAVCCRQGAASQIEPNAGLPHERLIEFRVGIQLATSLRRATAIFWAMGVNIAARPGGIAMPVAICLPEQAYLQVTGRLDLRVTDRAATQLKNVLAGLRLFAGGWRAGPGRNGSRRGRGPRPASVLPSVAETGRIAAAHSPDPKDGPGSWIPNLLPSDSRDRLAR
jgi:hypothetical protein